MYGTIARAKVKPGQVEALAEAMYPDRESSPGYVASYVYRMDHDPNEVWMVVAFESKEAYVANAQRPGTHGQYTAMRKFLVEDPEWHDGEILVPSQL